MLGVITGYPSDTTYEYYDFIKRNFLVSHDLTIREGQFATPHNFDPSLPPATNQPPPIPEAPPAPKPIYDMIKVQRPPKVVGYANSATGSINEKPMFEEAMNSPDKNEWVKAMEDEINSIRQNETWRLVKLPPGRKPISVKWVLNVKHDAKGKITKRKARLVARGFSPQFGFDYDETYVLLLLKSLYHYVRDHYERGTFNVEHIPTDEQLADIVTKPLPRIKHQCIVHALRLDEGFSAG
jgi:hypothetical protein